ncbi:MAG: hypothetical protein GX077_04115 [Tissierellia bacterium]|nr:hypothetical protein [Tissierellia bacterium]
MEKIDISPKIKDEALYKNLSLALGLILLVLGIKDKELTKLAIGILFVFYYTYKKNIYLTEDGVLFTYKGLLFNKKELLDKNYIQEVLVVKQGIQSTLYFVMEPASKKIAVDTEKLDDIIKFLRNRYKVYISVEPRP